MSQIDLNNKLMELDQDLLCTDRGLEVGNTFSGGGGGRVHDVPPS